jgi:hypothetical protein
VRPERFDPRDRSSRQLDVLGGQDAGEVPEVDLVLEPMIGAREQFHRHQMSRPGDRNDEAWGDLEWFSSLTDVRLDSR